MVLDGVIETIIFQNPQNGFSVIRVATKKKSITAVGTLSQIFVGQGISITGDYVDNPKFGRQFKIDSYSLKEPKTTDGIIKYLSSGLIPGIGPVTAQKIVDKFGEDTLDIIEHSPQKLSKIKGVSAQKAMEIGLAFMEIRKMQSVVMFLQGYDISTNLAVKIFNKYGERARDIISHNPYKLVEDMYRVGFKTADKIALSVGILEDSKFRMRAGLVYILNESSEKDGNTYLPVEDVYVALGKLLHIDISDRLADFDDVVSELIIDCIVKRCNFYDVDCLMLCKFYDIELKLATKLLTLNHAIKKAQDIDSEIETFEQINHVTLHIDQRNAIKQAINNGVCVITGGPGTGKTTIIKCILGILKRRCGKIALLAPTGRAAKRMSESCGKEASTIHRALLIDYEDEDTQSDRASFYYNEANKFPFDAVIVDEVSMVDVNLMLSLISALKSGTRLILVGDKNQLPSVGAGNVLADIIGSKIIACAELTHIYRQSEDSLIISNAHAINRGEMPVIDNHSKDFFYEAKQDPYDIARTILNLVSKRLPSYLNIDPLKIQVLAPMRMGPCGVDNLNDILQDRLNPRSFDKEEIMLDYHTFRVGDKVMQTANNYTQEWHRERSNGSWEIGEAVFNGDIGFVTDINEDLDSIEVTFDDGRVAEYNREDARQLTLSYAITIHKSQGSEFDVVVMPIIAGAKSIITRNLLYTAVTRAKDMVVLVGAKKNLHIMISNNYTAERYSALKIFLEKQARNMEVLNGKSEQAI